MPYLFFWSSAAVIWAVTLFLHAYKKPLLPKVVIGIATVGYSMINDAVLGEIFGLFCYIDSSVSVVYMLLGALLIYPPLNILYVSFLPGSAKKDALYTILWSAALLLFEVFSVWAGTIVFTGWRMFPWSVALYAVSYLWIYFFYRHLVKSLK